MRRVPLRLVRHGCRGPSDARLASSLAAATEVFAPAGVNFYVRDDVCLPDSPWYRRKVEDDDRLATWAEVYGPLRTLFPAPRDAYPAGTSKTLVEWLKLATTAWAKSDEIVVHVRLTGTRGETSFPEGGRLISVAPGLFDDLPGTEHEKGHGTKYLFAHELGHYLGLRHTFAGGKGRDPRTGKPWSQAARWDLVYLPGSPDRFFSSEVEASVAPNEDLELIEHFSGEKGASSNCTANEYGMLTCILDKVHVSGDSALKGLSFPTQEPGHWALNVMTYGDMDLPRKLSASQIEMIKVYLSKDSPVLEEFIPKSDYPQGVTQLWGLRPQLGLVQTGDVVTALLAAGSALTLTLAGAAAVAGGRDGR